MLQLLPLLEAGLESAQEPPLHLPAKCENVKIPPSVNSKLPSVRQQAFPWIYISAEGSTRPSHCAAPDTPRLTQPQSGSGEVKAPAWQAAGVLGLF